VADGGAIDTGSTGSYGFTVTATDKAGNTTSLTHDYTVAGSVPSPNCTIKGTPANDTISGTPADDTICAGNGNDTIKGLGGNDILEGDGGRIPSAGALATTRSTAGPVPTRPPTRPPSTP